MGKLTANFYVCRKCGQTMNRKRMPRKCNNCGNKQVGEIQIKWKNLW